MDPDAQEITLNYTEGSLVMVLGNAKDLFGENNELLDQEGETVSEEVQGHPRIRVIGGTSVQVAAHSRVYTKWPSSSSSAAAAGRKAKMRWKDSDGWWTVRYTGSASALGDFLSDKSTKAVEFTTSRGSKYGPYAGALIDGN